ncbi:MAG TPA: hypothetical protein PLP29_01095 [Candidatus Ozemobacteraceae bacterium]|nr:hypothetical protein [Candidatus Ozemobacteraceae bacterium]
MMRIRTLMLLLVALIVLPGPAVPVLAVPYQAGPHVLDLDIRNATMQLIPHGKARVSYANGKIKVYAYARGYRSVKETFEVGNVQPGLFKRDVMLPDPVVQVLTTDLQDEPISSAYIQTDQWGVAADKFRVTAFIPRLEWPLPTTERVQLLGSYLGLPVKYTCEIEPVEEFYRVRFLITRGLLKDCEYQLSVLFNTEKPASPAVRARLCRLLDRPNIAVQPDPETEEAAEALCHFVAAADELTPALGDANDPAPLASLTAARRRFDALHAHP